MSDTPPQVLEIIKEARHKQYKEIYLLGGSLKQIPDELFQLTELETIRLSNNNITIVPDTIYCLKKLKLLDLRGNPLQKVANVKGLFLDFSVYQKSKNQISTENISGLKIDLEGGLMELPGEVFELPNLTALDLSGNRLTQIPESISKLQNLNVLDLSINQLTQIPESISKLQNLTTLYLWGNQLKQIPELISKLQNLKILNLSRNQLTKIPEAISKLKNLKILDLSSNQLTQIPEAISKLQNLTKLDLGDNRLTQIPESTSKLHNLKILDLSINQLTQIPEAISKLQNLTKLDLSGNKFNEIPDVIYEIFSLKKINLNNRSWYENKNQIKEISPKILQLSNLHELDLSKNPIENPPLEVVEKGVGAIKDYFRQLQDSGEDYLYEAKLLIVGEGGAGKTTLAKKIEDPDYQLQDEITTKGIDVIEWNFSMEKGENFRVNIWDFGGQEIYHATHQFFLTKRSLYTLVADTRKEDTDFNYWLNVVELLSDNSPLLIIKNEKQDRHREINENQLRGRFNNLKEVMATNLATNRDLERVVKEIKHYITILPHIGARLPKTWKKVRETLEKDARNYIDLDLYLMICEQNGFTRIEDKLQLSGYLHDLGVCLHFQEDPLLKKTVILKPKWGTDAVYKVLDNNLVIKNEGRFTRKELAQIWNEPQYAEKQEELLQLMINFKLCYEIETSGVFIAPQWLKANMPNYQWDETNNLILRYTYEFMPKGIITRFIVTMHKYIANQQLVWKEGVVLEKDETRAEVIEDYSKREIKIRIAGKYKKELLIIVTYELDQIHESFNRLIVKKLIPCNCPKCKGSQNPFFYDYNILRRFLFDRKPIQCQISYEMVDVYGLIDDVMDRRELYKEPESRLSEKGKVTFEGTEEFIKDLIANPSNPRREEVAVVKEIKKKEENNILLGVLSFGLLVFLVFTSLIGVGYFITEKKLPFSETFLVFSVVAIAFVMLIIASILVYDRRIQEETWLKVIFSDLVNFPVKMMELILKKGGRGNNRQI